VGADDIRLLVLLHWELLNVVGETDVVFFDRSRRSAA
jgi:hypothetical protein